MTKSLPANTTSQEDLTHAGQRKINLIWEVTQAIIAIVIVVANIIAAIMILHSDDKTHKEFPFVLSSSMFLVIGFYFSRTNHQSIGGIGTKPPQSAYTGR